MKSEMGGWGAEVWGEEKVLRGGLGAPLEIGEVIAGEALEKLRDCQIVEQPRGCVVAETGGGTGPGGVRTQGRWSRGDRM